MSPGRDAQETKLPDTADRMDDVNLGGFDT